MFTYYASDESLQTAKHLSGVLRFHNLPLGLSDELLDAHETVSVQVRPEPLVDLVEDQLSELVVLTSGRVKDAVDKASREQLVGGNALAHDERLVGFGIPQAQDQRATGTALGHKPNRAKGREQKGVWRAVNEVGVGNKGGGEPYDGPVEANDEDFGMCVESLRDVQVEGYTTRRAREISRVVC